MKSHVQILGNGIMTPVTSEEYHKIQFLCGAIEKLGFACTVSQFTITTFSDYECMKMILAAWIDNDNQEKTDPYKHINGSQTIIDKIEELQELHRIVNETRNIE